MKQKTDSRVKAYRTLLVPESMHSRIKREAKARGVRLNHFVPSVIKKGLEVTNA
jgi:predicted HicB family RNase H-like nuclease